MMTNIVDCDLDTVAIGQRVSVAFKDIDGIATRCSRPPDRHDERRLASSSGQIIREIRT